MDAHSQPTAGRKSKTLQPSGPPEKPLPKSVWIYKLEEVNHDSLANRTKEVLGKVAFVWQLKIGAAVLCGEDVIIDVGTSGGKSLGFFIPLVLYETDITLRVTPLTALMIDQVSTVFL